MPRTWRPCGPSSGLTGRSTSSMWPGSARVVQGDLGESLWTKRPVLEEIVRRLPVSAELGAMAIVFGLLLALPIGVLAAIRQDTMKDYAARSLAIIGLSMPAFWKATLIIVFSLHLVRLGAAAAVHPVYAVSLAAPEPIHLPAIILAHWPHPPASCV